MRTLWLIVLASCATGGDAGGGGTDLPNRGFAPYERVVDAEEATRLVLSDPDRTLGAPFARVEDGRVALYFEACDGDDCEIGRAESADGFEFSEPEYLLEGRAPYLVGERMVLVRGEAIVEAKREGDWKVTRTLLEGPGLGSPSFVEGRLYYTSGEGLHRATADFEAGPVILGPAEGCVDTFGAPTVCWDAAPPAGAEVRQTRTAAGRTLLRLVYAARGLGFAASEGEAWVRFAFNPALPVESQERDPSNLRFGDRYLLYFGYGRRNAGIALAVNAGGYPSEDF